MHILNREPYALIWLKAGHTDLDIAAVLAVRR
jgi:hypothetical protein